jgi:hypothetical protein
VIVNGLNIEVEKKPIKNVHLSVYPLKKSRMAKLVRLMALA